jgi:hypothetical protein
MNNFYIYIYLDSRKPGKYCYENICFIFKPFYVGKGKNRRYLNINERSDYFIKKINKIKKLELKPIVFKLYENLSEKESLDKETELINEINIKNPGILVNMTDGGEGTSGYEHTEKTKKLMSKNHADFNGKNHPMYGKHHSEKTKIKFRELHKGSNHSEKTKKKISEKLKGENNPNYGKHPSEGIKEKMSKNRKGKCIGGNHTNFKMTNQKIIDIQSDIEKGDLNQRKIAKKHGVCQTMVSKIKTGKLCFQ